MIPSLLLTRSTRDWLSKQEPRHGGHARLGEEAHLREGRDAFPGLLCWLPRFGPVGLHDSGLQD